jgi:hypothetical protein
VGTGTNIWSAFIVDAFDTNAPIQRKTGLTVSSGYLWIQTSSYTIGDTRLPLGAPGPMANTYSGPTLVSGGLLQVDADIPNSPVTVYGAGTLVRGTGTLGRPVAIGSGGTLSMGDSIGNLVINNNLVFSNGSTCIMKNFQDGPTNDQVRVLFNLTYGGNLIVTNLYNAPFTNGQVIKLFDATHYYGAFSSISLPNVLTYSNHLATDGAITILQSSGSINLYPCPVTMSKTPSNMTLSWPSDRTGWRLTTQTNALTNGVRLTDTWYTVSGSDTTNAITLPINKNQPAIFYRLTYP